MEELPGEIFACINKVQAVRECVEDSEPKLLKVLEQVLKESRLLRAEAEKLELPLWPTTDAPATEDQSETVTEVPCLVETS